MVRPDADHERSFPPWAVTLGSSTSTVGRDRAGANRSIGVGGPNADGNRQLDGFGFGRVFRERPVGAETPFHGDREFVGGREARGGPRKPSAPAERGSGQIVSAAQAVYILGMTPVERMDKSAKCPTRDELRATIRGWDPTLREDSPAFAAALLLLAALYLGSGHLEQLCRATGVRRPSRLVARNLRAAGVWTADGRTVADWHGPRGETAFWCDVNVAIGVFEKCESHAKLRAP